MGATDISKDQQAVLGSGDFLFLHRQEYSSGDDSQTAIQSVISKTATPNNIAKVMSSVGRLRIAGRLMNDDWSSYIELRECGSSPQEVWNRSLADGLTWEKSVRMIRSVFGLTLAEAKEVKMQTEGMNMPLDDYQRDFILPTIEEAEQQGLFDDDA